RATCSGTSHTEGLTKTFIATVVIAVIGLILSKIAGFQGNKHQGNRYNLKSTFLGQIALVATVRKFVWLESVSCQIR
ncbi:hypothetical protein, partial [Paenibacillus macerans]|uniref:hypothetical protein n=1 Tax=Paenibacillus macerans TaxID=44252 RepID=UPI00227F940E